VTLKIGDYISVDKMRTICIIIRVHSEILYDVVVIDVKNVKRGHLAAFKFHDSDFDPTHYLLTHYDEIVYNLSERKRTN
jgi:hypothetical protein